MKNLSVEVVYKWEDETGKEHNRQHTSKASLGGDWQQWGATQDELCDIMPLTEKLNEATNEFIMENCENEEQED